MSKCTCPMCFVREQRRERRERERSARYAYKVYVLIDPITGKVRYAGSTHETLPSRLRRHCDDWRDGKRDTCERKRTWIANLKEQGFRPFILMLHSCARRGEALKWEREEIAQFISEGCDLLNGNLPLSPELAWRVYDLRMAGETYNDIAKLTNVNYSTVYNVIQRMTGNVTPYMRESGYAPYDEPRPEANNANITEGAIIQ